MLTTQNADTHKRAASPIITPGDVVNALIATPNGALTYLELEAVFRVSNNKQLLALVYLLQRIGKVTFNDEWSSRNDLVLSLPACRH